MGSRLRAMLVVAVTTATVAACAARHDTIASAPGYVTRLIGVTWQGGLPILTVVFTARTVRIFDGCSDELDQVSIGRRALDIGRTLGPASTCGGAAGGSPTAVDRFDAVVSGRHLSWRLDGDRLRLTNRRGQSVQLHDAGRALAATGQAWALERYNDPRGYSRSGNFWAAQLHIDDGEVHASDLCNDLTGSATVSAAKITFTDVRSTGRSCSATGLSALTDSVVDRVLSGTVEYAIRGGELIVDGGRAGLLIYLPTG